MSKTKTILIAGGAVSAILIVAAAVVAALDISKASKLKSECDSDFNNLKSYYSEPVFPSKANIETEKENGAELLRRIDTLTNILSRGAVTVTNYHSRGSFNRIAEASVSALRAEAPKDEAGASIIPANFYFGFEHYDAKEGRSPVSDEVVPRLIKQLRLTELLVRELYAAGVAKIEKVSRIVFEEGGDAGTSSGSQSRPSGGRRGSRASSSSSTSGGALGALTVEAIESAPVPVSRERFGFQFTTREAGLESILNRLNALEPFAIVNKVDFMKTEDDVKFPAPPSAASAASAQPAAKPGIAKPPEGKSSRVISGALREAPIRVALIVDVYTFGDEPEVTE